MILGFEFDEHLSKSTWEQIIEFQGFIRIFERQNPKFIQFFLSQKIKLDDVQPIRVLLRTPIKLYCQSLN